MCSLTVYCSTSYSYINALYNFYSVMLNLNIIFRQSLHLTSDVMEFSDFCQDCGIWASLMPYFI